MLNEAFKWTALALDVVLFFVKLAVGITFRSTAFVADALRTTYIIVSRVTALWSSKVQYSRPRDNDFTYGWQRIQVITAMLSGALLAGLSFSIFIEAVSQFIHLDPMSQPFVVFIVGAVYLRCSSTLRIASFVMRRISFASRRTNRPQSPTKLLPLKKMPVAACTQKEHVNASSNSPIQERRITLPDSTSAAVSISIGKKRKSSSSMRSNYSLNKEAIHMDPENFRNDIAAARLGDLGSAPRRNRAINDKEAILGSGTSLHRGTTNASNPLQNLGNSASSYQQDSLGIIKPCSEQLQKYWAYFLSHWLPPIIDDTPIRHQSLTAWDNSNAAGDIIITLAALVIWRVPAKKVAYIDPAFGLCIALLSTYFAGRLIAVTSRILLEGTPLGIRIDDIKEEIMELPGIISVHHVHVWQLDDIKCIASMHIQVDFDFRGEGSARYMCLARAVRQCLHNHGIHSSTIQPEFCLDANHSHSEEE